MFCRVPTKATQWQQLSATEEWVWIWLSEYYSNQPIRCQVLQNYQGGSPSDVCCPLMVQGKTFSFKFWSCYSESQGGETGVLWSGDTTQQPWFWHLCLNRGRSGPLVPISKAKLPNAHQDTWPQSWLGCILIMTLSHRIKPVLNYAGLTGKVGDGSGLLHSGKTSAVSGWWNIFHWSIEESDNAFQ